MLPLPLRAGSHLLLLLLLLGCALLGRAHAVSKNGPTKVLGFTQDGASFVFIETELGQEEGDLLIRVIDARTWEPHDYPIRLREGTDQEQLERSRREQSRFDAWHKQHPTRCIGGRKSLDGKIELKIATSGTRLFIEQLPQGGQLTSAYKGPNGLASGGATIEILLEEDRPDDDPLQRWLLRWKEESTYSFSAQVTPCWSPDGRRLALMIERHDGFFRDPGTRQLYLLPVRGPRVELRARRPRSPAVRAVALALDRAGFVVSRLAAVKAPATTMVRTIPEFEELFPKLAELLGQIDQYVAEPSGSAPSDLVIELAEPSAPAAPATPQRPAAGAAGGAPR